MLYDYTTVTGLAFTHTRKSLKQSDGIKKIKSSKKTLKIKKNSVIMFHFLIYL